MFKMPPPVGIGPLPPYIIPPCHVVQSPPEKKSSDDVVESIIEDLKMSIMQLVQKIVAMAMQMARAAAAAAEAQAAAAASFLELPPALTPEAGGGTDTAKEVFEMATILTKKADVEHTRSKLQIRDLQLRQANNKEEDWPICRAKLNEEKAKRKHQKALEEMKKAQLNVGKPDEDAPNRDAPDVHEKPGVPFGLKEGAPCIPYDLFGCKCPEQPDATTLNSIDCHALTGVRAAKYQAEKDMIFAVAKFGKAIADAAKATMKKKALDKEDESIKPKEEKNEPPPPPPPEDSKSEPPAPGNSSNSSISGPAPPEPPPPPSGKLPQSPKKPKPGMPKPPEPEPPGIPSPEPQLPDKDAQASQEAAAEGVDAKVIKDAKRLMGSGGDNPPPSGPSLRQNVHSLKSCRSMGCDAICADRAFQLRNENKFCNCYCCTDLTGSYCWKCEKVKVEEPKTCNVIDHIGLPLENHPKK